MTTYWFVSETVLKCWKCSSNLSVVGRTGVTVWNAINWSSLIIRTLCNTSEPIGLVEVKGGGMGWFRFWFLKVISIKDKPSNRKLSLIFQNIHVVKRILHTNRKRKLVKQKKNSKTFFDMHRCFLCKWHYQSIHRSIGRIGQPGQLHHRRRRLTIDPKDHRREISNWDTNQDW